MIQEDGQQVEKAFAARRPHRVTRMVLTRPSVGVRGQTTMGDREQRPLIGERDGDGEGGRKTKLTRVQSSDAFWRSRLLVSKSKSSLTWYSIMLLMLFV